MENPWREILRQASVALVGRVVTLWEVSARADILPLLASVPEPSCAAAILDIDNALHRWGAPIVPGSRWVGCRLDDVARWCVAPVRKQPPAPPPGGVERRSRERLILELAGLCLGAIDATASSRLPPSEASWEHARQPNVVAHEVGNQLTVARGNIDFGISEVRAAPSLDPELRERLIEDLTNAAKGIDQATNYLVAIQDRSFAGLDRASRFDAIPVVRSCVTLERPLARNRGVAPTWESSVDSAFLYGDPNVLYRVITNLIRNAIEASRERKDAVLVTLARTGETLTLTVRDRGVGIAPEHLDHIFDAGFTTKETGTGSGMGLALSCARSPNTRSAGRCRWNPRWGRAAPLHWPCRFHHSGAGDTEAKGSPPLRPQLRHTSCARE